MLKKSLLGIIPVILLIVAFIIPRFGEEATIVESEEPIQLKGQEEVEVAHNEVIRLSSEDSKDSQASEPQRSLSNESHLNEPSRDAGQDATTLAYTPNPSIAPVAGQDPFSYMAELEIELKLMNDREIEIKYKNKKGKKQAQIQTKGSGAKEKVKGEAAVHEVERLMESLSLSADMSKDTLIEKVFSNLQIDPAQVEELDIEVKFSNGKEIEVEQEFDRE